MSDYTQGDIVMVAFPYSEDLSKSKLRPVLIVSNSSLVEEFIGVQITSNLSRVEFTSVSILPEDTSSELPSNSVIRSHLIHTLSKKSVIKKISRLTNEDKLNRVLENINIILCKD